ncbi:MAG: polymerase subunit delta, partial [Patescibacteria group bacterium]|nr:polymerase subunit delta [Patescibacteria group bacterium]
MEIRKNLILFTGDSSAVLRKNLSSWMGSFAEKYGDSNVATVRIGETDPASVVSELLSMPFFAEKRLVVFEGIPRLRSLGSSKSEESGNDSEESFENPSDPAAAVEAAVLSVFDKIPDSTFAIFVS